MSSSTTESNKRKKHDDEDVERLMKKQVVFQRDEKTILISHYTGLPESMVCVEITPLLMPVFCGAFGCPEVAEYYCTHKNKAMCSYHGGPIKDHDGPEHACHYCVRRCEFTGFSAKLQYNPCVDPDMKARDRKTSEMGELMMPITVCDMCCIHICMDCSPGCRLNYNQIHESRRKLRFASPGDDDIYCHVCAICYHKSLE